MEDPIIRQHISALVAEEHALRERLAEGDISLDEEHTRLKELETELDQCWDLLRQRDARREFGVDPDSAQVRSPRTVEGYQG
jgi:predicted nuclease with TOPRIM domain